MWTLFLVAGLITAQPQQGGGQGAIRAELPDVQARVAAMVANRADPLELTLASPVQLPNGRRVGATVRPAVSSEPWLVYSRGSLCQSVISHGPVPTDALEGWKVTVTQRSRTATQVMVGVIWSRLWERGKPVAAGSGGTSELTLQRGDRLSLDTITRVAQPGACAGTTKSLELHVGAVTMNSPVPAGDSPIDGIVDAELWMVHTLPNGTESVEHQIVRLVNGVMGFSFKGGPVETSDGPIAIELSGQLKAVRQEDGSRGLWASLTRGMTRQSTGVTSTSPPTATTVKWLTPGEVQSFELPPLQLYAARAMGAPGGGGGGGRGGVISSGASGGGASGGGAAAGGVARSGGGGGGVATGPTTSGLPNLLEGHRLSLRVRLVETSK